MVLKSDDHTDELFRETDTSADSEFPVLASEQGRGQKGLGQGKDKSSFIKRANDAKELFCSGASKDDSNRFCEFGPGNNLGRGAEVMDSMANSRSLGLGYNMEGMHHESVKHIQISEATIPKLSASSSYKTHDQTEKDMGSNDVSGSDEKCEHSLQSFPGDDGPDVKKHVKVCNTCGDSGLVGLLALCSRCSNGAEHTYCMREMLRKVPEGDWLCEECKYNEALEARKQEHLKPLVTERNEFLGGNSISSDVPSELDYPMNDSDKTKGKPTNRFSTGTDSGGDTSENAWYTTTNLKGNHLKSNSFSSSKANIKGSEEVQKQKLVVDVKDGPRKLSGKSMSCKGLGRSNVSESKVKLKGHKKIRDRTSLERKNSIKLDNSYPVQTTVNSTKLLSSGDCISTSSISSCDYKNAQSDGKLTSFSYQANNASRKSPDAMANLGEVKRLSSTNLRGTGASSFAEAKPSHISSKNGSTSSSYCAFDGSYGANGNKVDVHDSQTDISPDNASSCVSLGSNGALVVANRRGFSLDSSTLRTKDGVHEENKLKAALAAATQKKLDIYRKKKVPEKLDESSMSTCQPNHAENAVFNQSTDIMAREFVHVRDTGLSNHTSNYCKHISIGSAKQFKAVDFESSEADQFTMSAIPEQEAIWQGGFEILRNGKPPDIYGGFQAHLSSIACDKVLEVVKKLPQKIVFKKVSRPSVWPSQFKEASVRDDNIALYFFAKDQESYLRSYKFLLDYMMKHDVALKGNINGVELLLFPSNHLEQGSQRWNALFYIWGIFRGRRAHFPDDRYPPNRPELANTLPRIEDNSSASCLSKNKSLQKLAVEVSSSSGNDTVVSRCEAPSSHGHSLQKSGPMVNGDCYNEGHVVEANSESGTAAMIS